MLKPRLNIITENQDLIKTFFGKINNNINHVSNDSWVTRVDIHEHVDKRAKQWP